jgi:flagellar motor switch protein FliM
MANAGVKARGEALSQGEIEALLASLPSDPSQMAQATAVGAPAPSAAMVPVPGKQVRTWDFRKPDKFSKDHMRSLLALHQNFSRIASSALTARLRTGVTMRVTSVDQGLYEEYIDLLPAQSIVNVISLKPLEGNILFEFQPELSMVMLDRLLGGSGGPVDASHELTDIEIALMRNLVRTLLESLREAWINLAEVEPMIEDVSNSPQLVQIAAPADIVVIVLLEVQVGNRLGTISLCIPHLVLEPLKQRLTTQVWVVSNRRRTSTPEMRAEILGNVRRAAVKVTAVLGETSVTVDEVIRLGVGDVLMLGPERRLNTRLRVGDQYRFGGEPGLVGTRLAVKITGTEEGEPYGDE